MTLLEEVKDRLKKIPQFRERRFRLEGIAEMIVEKYPLFKNHHIPLSVIADALKEAENINRYVRMAQADPDNKELRGSDYKDGETLEQKQLLDFGYQPMHKKIRDKILAKE